MKRPISFSSPIVIALCNSHREDAGIQTLPIIYALGNWGLDWRPGSDELRSRQQLMRDEGPPFIAELMDELRVRHLGAPPKPHDGPGPFERVDAAHAAAAEQEEVDG
jgi:hypothetical protein